MHRTPQITRIGILLVVMGVLAVVPRAGGGTSTNAAQASGGGASTNSTHADGGGLLCAALIGSGIFGDIFTVAPMTPAHREDPSTAVEFAPIWSDTHQATVGSQTSGGPPQIKPAVAMVKLPISFSETDRQRFVAAGWKAHSNPAGIVSYCLDRAGRGAPASAAAQAMICVTAAAP
jgi:hypothetical protein